MLAELVAKGILRKLVPAKLQDFRGTFNYLGALMQHNLTLADKEPDASYAQIRQLITEYAILPMGSPNLRQNGPVTTSSILLYGPPGVGKTMIARAIATHINALFIDISPYTASESPYKGESKGLNKMLYIAFRVAKEFSPAVIYIDEVDKYFTGGKGKKKKKKKGKGEFSKLKKDLVGHKKFIKAENRVLIIGCTSQPGEASKADLKSFFNKHIYIPHPNYSTRKDLWEFFLSQHGDVLNPKFSVNTISQLSEGYTGGSIKTAVTKVMTEQRKANLKWRPLTISEFISPLSRTHCIDIGQYNEFADLNYELLGIKAAYDREKKEKDDAENPGGKDSKKGGKKGKKK